MITVFLFTFFYFIFPVFSAAEDIEPSVSFADDLNNVYALVSFTIPHDYHAYSHESGTSGMPTTLRFILEGEGKLHSFYPPGTEEPDPSNPGKKNSVYRDRIDIISVLPKAASGKLYTGKLSLLLCSDKRCIPIRKSIEGTVPTDLPSLEETGWNLASFGKELKNFSPAPKIEHGTPPPPLKGSELEEKAAPDILMERQKEKPEIRLLAPEDFDLSLKPEYFSGNLEVFSLWKALVFGIAAGLMLNAMPCVLPVLGLKVNALLGSANFNSKTALAAFRYHNFWFIAGIMTFFSLLGLFIGGADLLWGQLFQSQTLVLLILMLVFLMGLSMFGVFTLPILDLKLGANSKNPASQAFCSGLLCTFLATPCSGPLLGGVLAWAFSQPVPIIMAVFLAVGLGMCLPYIAFCIWPQMGRILPRPGKWMHVFETILGFLLLGTALYLLSILPQNKRMHILCALLAIAFCAWILGRFCSLVAPVWRRITGSLFAVGVICFSVIWIMQPPKPATDWIPFDAAIFTDNHGEKNMLLEFTADWCPNCKYLEAATLTEEFLNDIQKTYDMDLIKVDITSQNPYAEKLLNQLGSRSIPVTALFPKGEKAGKPLVLRDLYTQESLRKALRQIF